MNKQDLVTKMAEKSGGSKTDAAKYLDSFLDTVSETLAAGEEVALIGFGTFKVNDRAARSGRNPQTGQTIQIAASKVPAFKAGLKLKDAVNQ